MNFKPIFKSFVHILNERLSNPALEEGFRELSEDTICFFLAAAFLQAGVGAHSIEMEVPHPVFDKQSWTMVDVRVFSPEGPIWIEVKFDKTVAKNKFGHLLNDICRLALLNSSGVALMLYVAPKGVEETLQKYLPDNGTTPLDLDTLDKHVKKPLKMMVLQKIEGIRVIAKRVSREEVGSLVCLLYEVSALSRS
jgi:hypothetical protein